MSQFGDFLDSTGLPQNTTVSQFAQFLDQQPQMTGAERALAFPASYAAKGVAEGAGVLGNVERLLNTYVTRPIYKALHNGNPGFALPNSIYTPNGVIEGHILPSSDQTTAPLRQAGLIDRPDLQPQNQFERGSAAALEGAGSVVPALLATGGTGAVPMLASGAGGGVGALYGGDLGGALGHPYIGQFAGGLLGGATGGVLGNAAIKTGNALLGNYGEMGQAYQSAGVPMRMTGDVSGSTPLQQIQAYSMRAPGAAGRMHAAASDVIDAFGNAAENAASGLGRSSSLQELGETAQNAGQQWINNFKAQSNTAHAAVDNAVGPAAPVQPTATSQIIQDITQKAGGNKAAESFLKSPLAKDVEGIISSAPNGSLPWQTVRALRTRVGEYLENPQLVADAGRAQAQRLYGALSDDLRATAAASSNPNALNLFDLANQYTRQGHDFIDGVLSPIMNKDAPSAASTILNSANRGDQLLGPLRQNLPQVADEAAAYKLRDMASSVNGQQNAAGTAVSPSSFLTDWNKLSPEGKAALFTDPGLQAKVDALAKISEGIRETSRQLNTSGTTHNAAIYDILKHVGGATGAVLGGHYGGGTDAGVLGFLLGEGGGALVGPVMNRSVSYLAANRPLARFLAAKGAGIIPGQGPLLGAAAGYNRLSATTPPPLLGYEAQPSQ